MKQNLPCFQLKQDYSQLHRENTRLGKCDPTKARQLKRAAFTFIFFIKIKLQSGPSFRPIKPKWVWAHSLASDLNLVVSFVVLFDLFF